MSTQSAAPLVPIETTPQSGGPPVLPAIAPADPIAPESFLPAGGVLYRVDSTRASFGELWRDCHPATVWIAWLAKLMGTRLPGSVNDPNVESLAPFAVSEEGMPQDVRSRVATMLKDLRGLGFDPGPPICYAIMDYLNGSRTWMFALPHPEGRAVARVTLRREGTAATKTHAYCELLSALSDGGFLWSTGAKATLQAPPGIRVRRHVGASPAELLASHERDLSELPGAAAVRRVTGRPGTVELLERHHLLVRDFHLRRRLFAPMSDADVRAALAVRSAYTSAAIQGFAYPGVMAEIERLQNRTASRSGGITILLLSLLAFVLLGVGGGTGALASKQNRELLLLLVPILFFHELGHYVAMRVFRYRNVRMFFIPMFGAAVSGTHYSAPGWKKAIVALMGPLPGILIGAGLGLAGMWLHNALMIKAAILALVLNGINLLPILPLDGGLGASCRRWCSPVITRPTWRFAC